MNEAETRAELIDPALREAGFCANQPHALLVRDIINQMKTSSDPHYCERVTADDGERGEQWLRTFQDNEKSIPTILTTSQKLSTGVDARNVRNIVLMRPINTMIEFKQIIGRGTRLFDGKDYFTIYDFVKAYEHFEDKEWDGEPMEPVATKPRAKPDGMEEEKPPEYEPPPERPKQIKIKLADGKERTIQHMMATSYYSPDGRPISANQMVENLFGELPRFFKDEDELRKIWSRPDKGASARFIRRDDKDKPFATGLKATDPAASARATAQCEEAGRAARLAQEKAEAAQRFEARLRAIEWTNNALKELRECREAHHEKAGPFNDRVERILTQVVTVALSRWEALQK